MPAYNLNEIEQKEIIPGYKARFVHSENVTIAFWNVKAGAILPEHSHVHEQISIVTKGEFELTVQGEKQIAVPQKVIIIPSNAKHSAIALTDCEITDIFYPVREDYKK